MSDPKYLYLLGPTGTGKTELSLKVAEDLQLPILNADSLQVYKHVDIGTAKPTTEEMGRAPHYLFDYIEPMQALTAAQYLQDICQVIETHNLKNLLFVGGSGFYLQALEKGLYPQSETPKKVKEVIECWIAEKGFADLYQWVCQRDPIAAQKISENDHYRIRRAVEVMITQEKTLTELKQEMKEKSHSPLPHHQALKVGLRMDKSLLRGRIVQRTKSMLSSGLIDEVQSLVDQGYKDWAPMKSVGYLEVLEHLQGQYGKEELAERIVTSTMQLIKKQMTWFKRDPSIHWFNVDESDKAFDFIKAWFS